MAAHTEPSNRKIRFWRWKRAPKWKAEATSMGFPFTIRPRKFAYPWFLLFDFYYRFKTSFYRLFTMTFKQTTSQVKMATIHSSSFPMLKKKECVFFCVHVCVNACTCTSLRRYVTQPQDKFRFCGFHSHITARLLPSSVTYKLLYFIYLSSYRMLSTKLKCRFKVWNDCLIY